MTTRLFGVMFVVVCEWFMYAAIDSLISCEWLMYVDICFLRVVYLCRSLLIESGVFMSRDAIYL